MTAEIFTPSGCRVRSAGWLRTGAQCASSDEFARAGLDLAAFAGDFRERHFVDGEIRALNFDAEDPGSVLPSFVGKVGVVGLEGGDEAAVEVAGNLILSDFDDGLVADAVFDPHFDLGAVVDCLATFQIINAGDGIVPCPDTPLEAVALRPANLPQGVVSTVASELHEEVVFLWWCILNADA